MTVKLNHTIVHARDRKKSAEFYSQIFGLPAPVRFGPFLDVETANDVTLAFLQTDEKIQEQHYAFLVSEKEFDEIFGRVKAKGLDYWADPSHEEKGRINTRDGGRGVYFNDPSGHYLEILTVPYGG